MAIGSTDPVLTQAAIFLGAAVVAVPVARRLQLGSILGYLAAGAAIGLVQEYFFGADEALQEAGDVIHFGEFGVVLLLFVIGLELKPSRLWRLRTEIFGLGFAQVLITTLVIGGALMAMGFRWPPAIVVGSALALSSTAFAIQILRERGDLTRPYGDRSFSILLFQDLAIIPLFALASLLAPNTAEEGNSSTLETVGIAVAAMGGLLVAGRYLLRPVFHVIAVTRTSEIFTAAALLVVVGAALLMQVAGLSMALGAFIAGVLLAETEYRHQIETDIEPFRGLFLGLFFMGVGMQIDWGAVLDNLAIVLGGAAGLYLIKGLILYGLARIRGSSHDDALKISAVLGQGGEFGFVIFGIAAGSGLILEGDSTLLSAIVALSMAMTPFVSMLIARFALAGGEESMDGVQGVEDAPEAPIIVAGFGRIGQVVARILRLRGYEVVLIDASPKQIRLAETFGNKVFFGDATRIDIMRMAGAEQAKAIFLCLDDREGARVAAERLRHAFPEVPLFASTYDRFSAIEMEKAGVNGVVRETLESSVRLAVLGLEELGETDAIEDTLEEFRRRDKELLQLQVEFGAEEGLRKLREGYSLEKEDG